MDYWAPPENETRIYDAMGEVRTCDNPQERAAENHPVPSIAPRSDEMVNGFMCGVEHGARTGPGGYSAGKHASP